MFGCECRERDSESWSHTKGATTVCAFADAKFTAIVWLRVISCVLHGLDNEILDLFFFILTAIRLLFPLNDFLRKRFLRRAPPPIIFPLIAFQRDAVSAYCFLR